MSETPSVGLSGSRAGPCLRRSSQRAGLAIGSLFLKQAASKAWPLAEFNTNGWID